MFTPRAPPRQPRRLRPRQRADVGTCRRQQQPPTANRVPSGSILFPAAHLPPGQLPMLPSASPAHAIHAADAGSRDPLASIRPTPADKSAPFTGSASSLRGCGGGACISRSAAAHGRRRAAVAARRRPGGASRRVHVRSRCASLRSLQRRLSAPPPTRRARRALGDRLAITARDARRAAGRAAALGRRGGAASARERAVGPRALRRRPVAAAGAREERPHSPRLHDRRGGGIHPAASAAAMAGGAAAGARRSNRRRRRRRRGPLRIQRGAPSAQSSARRPSRAAKLGKRDGGRASASTLRLVTSYMLSDCAFSLLHPVYRDQVMDDQEPRIKCPGPVVEQVAVWVADRNLLILLRGRPARRRHPPAPPDRRGPERRDRPHAAPVSAGHKRECVAGPRTPGTPPYTS